MFEFRTPVDIGNRACDHCGVDLLDPTLGLNDPGSTRAYRINAVLGKLRQAELQENNWYFAIKRAVIRAVDTNTRLIATSLWTASATYYVGSIVADGTGSLWISNTANNIGLEPLLSSSWDAYFGPLTASLYDSSTTYFAGEVVYTAAGDGTSRVYLSLQSANADNPATATAWDVTATYSKNATITRSSVAYQSLIDLNIGNDPALAPALFDIAHSYSIGNHVGASDGVIYTSITNGNVGHDPTTDGGTNWTNTGVLNPWTSVFVGGIGSAKWLQIGGAEFPAGVTLSNLNLTYPIGAGPSSQSDTRNVYRLPAGFLKLAPQDPKAGSWTWFGSPTNRSYDDWNLEGNYLVTQTADLIPLRFVADVTDVTAMHPMFCEGWGARIGVEVCEPLTQSSDKVRTIAQKYDRFMGKAKLANAIEIGSIEPPMDDYLACRY